MRNAIAVHPAVFKFAADTRRVVVALQAFVDTKGLMEEDGLSDKPCCFRQGTRYP